VGLFGTITKATDEGEMIYDGRTLFEPFKPIDAELAITAINGFDLAHGRLVEVRPPTPEEYAVFSAAMKEYWKEVKEHQTGNRPEPPKTIVCQGAKHCALGELLFRAGMPDEALFALSDDPCEWEPDAEATQLLWSVYGIRRYHAVEIFSANDLVNSGQETPEMHERRRQEVFATLRDLAETQQEDPVVDTRLADEYEAVNPAPEDEYDDEDDDDLDDDFEDDDDDDLDDEEDDEDFEDEDQLDLMGDEEE
jgi:hypothetical protein